MDKAIHEFPAPSGCRECCLSETVLTEKGFALKCKSADTLAHEEDDGRHPDCPLKIVPETPEGELKPCPFCGGEAEPYGEKTGNKGVWGIQCLKCDAKVPNTYPFGPLDKAIAAWNRRA